VRLLLAGFGLSAASATAGDKHAAPLLDANSGNILYQS